jgi:hypothetical protein
LDKIGDETFWTAYISVASQGRSFNNVSKAYGSKMRSKIELLQGMASDLSLVLLILRIKSLEF